MRERERSGESDYISIFVCPSSRTASPIHFRSFIVLDVHSSLIHTYSLTTTPHPPIFLFGLLCCSSLLLSMRSLIQLRLCLPLSLSLLSSLFGLFVSIIELQPRLESMCKRRHCSDRASDSNGSRRRRRRLRSLNKQAWKKGKQMLEQHFNGCMLLIFIFLSPCLSFFPATVSTTTLIRAVLVALTFSGSGQANG